uniref:Uncharacterized protein n=1 Tax=Arundo donax TaxID=35708 RepID=A0A0A9HFF0_ARUDO
MASWYTKLAPLIFFLHDSLKLGKSNFNQG